MHVINVLFLSLGILVILAPIDCSDLKGWKGWVVALIGAVIAGVAVYTN